MDLTGPPTQSIIHHHHHHYHCNPIWDIGCQSQPSSHHDLGPEIPTLLLQLSCAASPLHVCCQVRVPGVSSLASLPFSWRVPGEGLPCDVGCRLAGGVTNPFPMSLKDVIFCRLLSCSLAQVLVIDGVQPANLENPSEAGVDECLDILYGGNTGSPGLGSIK